MEKEVTKIANNGNESVVIMSYEITFIYSARFKATSLSSLVDNLKNKFIRSNEIWLWLFSCRWNVQGQFDKIKMFIVQVCKILSCKIVQTRFIKN